METQIIKENRNELPENEILEHFTEERAEFVKKRMLEAIMYYCYFGSDSRVDYCLLDEAEKDLREEVININKKIPGAFIEAERELFDSLPERVKERIIKEAKNFLIEEIKELLELHIAEILEDAKRKHNNR